MEKIISIVILIVSLSYLPIQGQDQTGSNQILNLDKGDVFTYKIHQENSYVTTYPEKGFIPTSKKIDGYKTYSNTTEDSKLWFEVLEKTQNSCYLFKYKKEYTILKGDREGKSISFDSRFPEYGKRTVDVIQCFLNTIYYHIRFCPTTGEMEVVNLKQIEKDLIQYLDSRGIPESYQRESFIESKFKEKYILNDLKFLHYLTYKAKEQKNPVKLKNGEIVQIRSKNKTNGHTSYEVEVKNYLLNAGSSSQQKMYTKTGTFTFDKNSGLLIKSDTKVYPNETKAESEKLYQSRSVIKNYAEHIELEYFPGQNKPTWICGKNRNGLSRIWLSTKDAIISEEYQYTEYQSDSSGFFAIPLGITENKRYTLQLNSSYGTPAGFGNIELFVKPGDSIFISHNETSNGLKYTGRGFEDSELLTRISLPMNLDRYFRLLPQNQIVPQTQIDYVDRIRNSILDKIDILEAKKSSISAEFYTYMRSEFNSVEAIMNYYDNWNSLYDKYSNGISATIENSLLQVPDPPLYRDYKILDAYKVHIAAYTQFRFKIYHYYNTGDMHTGLDSPGLEFNKLLLSGFPFYIGVGSEIAKMIPENIGKPGQSNNADYLINDFLENCNHQESRDYIKDLLRRDSLISIGSKRPEMELLDLDGNPFNWEKTEGKVVLLMLYSNYNYGREWLYSENLFKKFGKNKKDVFILRISAGSSFDNWKKQNTKYSTEGHQMYYVDGKHAFNRQFLMTGLYRPRYLVINKQGIIFRTASNVANLEGAINTALKQSPPPKTPCLETRMGKILPGVIIGIILSFILYRIIIIRKIRKRELKHRLSTLEQKAIKAQLNPHFLFNCLNTIQNIINKNKLHEANDYLISFAGLIRRILNYTEKEEISIHEEIETLKIYLELEKLRFEFNTTFEIDPEVDIYSTMIPPLLLQPAVENAILHGLDPKKGDKALKIGVVMQSDSILFRIDDNGIGRVSADQKNSIGGSKGLDIIKSRIKLMNDTQQGRFSLEIIDKKDESGEPAGTLVEVVIPDER